MDGPWVIAFAGLWIVVLIEALLILVLYNQLGIMYLGRAEARMRDGLAVSTLAPDFQAVDETGALVQFAQRERRPTLLIFAAENCTLCEKIVPDLNDFVVQQGTIAQLLFLVRATLTTPQSLSEKYSAYFPIWVTDSDVIAHTYKVGATPFAFLIAEDGKILAKGLLNGRDHINALMDPLSQGVTGLRQHARLEVGQNG